VPVRVLSSKLAFGALADSYYEYLLKQWIQSPEETRFKEMWLEVMDEVASLVRPQPKAGNDNFSSFKLVEIASGGETLWKMDHLSCFAGGMLVLGLHELPSSDLVVRSRNGTWWHLAEGLTESCVQMWTSSKSGLAPESFSVRPTAPFDFTEVPQTGRHSFLRPETAETLFYLHRITGDEKYRVSGRRLFKAIVEHSKVGPGFATVQDVNVVPTQKVDEMHTFVMAETFKYLYLLFSPADRLDLGRFVFNTEGHPLPRPKKR